MNPLLRAAGLGVLVLATSCGVSANAPTRSLQTRIGPIPMVRQKLEV